MNCAQTDGFLDAYRTGEVSASRRDNIRRHLAACAACRFELERLATLARRLQAARLPAPHGLRERVMNQVRESYGHVETGLGRIWVAFGSRGISMVQPGDLEAPAFEAAYARRFGGVLQKGIVPEKFARAVQLAAVGEWKGSVPFNLDPLPEFERRVLERLLQVPRGEVRTYSWLARDSGRPGAARAVGNTMARNPIPLLIPCHRVVPSSGGVGNYAFGSGMKRDLLRLEGVPMEELDRLAAQGVKILGCSTTRIYCNPSCRHIRRARPENRVPFRNAALAESEGYRACRSCKPA